MNKSLTATQKAAVKEAKSRARRALAPLFKLIKDGDTRIGDSARAEAYRRVALEILHAQGHTKITAADL